MNIPEATVTIKLSAITENIRELKRIARCSLMPVVKSDAYGHGIVEVSRTLVAEGIWGLGISSAKEIVQLRNSGIKGRLFLLSGFWPDEIEPVIRYRDVVTGICTREQLEILNSACSAAGTWADAHIKLDTGMGRYGFLPGEFLQLIKERGRWSRISFKGLYSHLANASEPADPSNLKQYETLYSVLREAGQAGWLPEETHMANSSGLIHGTDTICTMARPGIAVYGAYPDSYASEKVQLIPAMEVRAPVSSVRILPEGHTTGYGSTYCFTRKTKVAILRTGYDNGYMRSLSNRADVILNGIRCPVIGRVCMQAIMVDASFAGEVKPGDEAVLWGSQKDETIRPEEVADWAGTISYELMCLAGGMNKKEWEEKTDHVRNRNP